MCIVRVLQDFQSVFYLARLFFMPTDAFVLPVIRSWFVEYSQTIAECNNEYDDILSKDKIATNKPQLKTLICKLVSYGDYSRAQTLLNTFFCSTEDDAAMTAVICSLFDNYAKLLGALDKLPPNDFYRLFYRWREECARAVSSSLSLSHDAPFHAVLRVMLGEDDTSLDSFEGVLLTRILYMRPECTVYALPQATQDVLKTFDVEDEKDFRLAPSAILEGNRRKLLALVEGTESRWLHGLLADALCLGGRGSLHGRDFDELVASRDASIDAYAAGIVSNLFWVHAINYSKTCSAPEETTVHRDILRWVSLDSDRTERKLLAACKSFAPGLVPALHERVGVEKVRRAAYADAMKHFILSGNVTLVSAYATALVSCDVGPSCDYRALIIATATVTRRCCNPALRNEVAHVESLADIYTSLAGLRTQEYLARLAEELKRPSAPTLVKFRLVRDVAHDLKDPRNEEVRKCLTKDIVTVIVGTLEEVCLSYQSEKIFAIMSPEDINTLRKIFTGLFLV